MNSELQVLNFGGVDCYEESGVVYLKLEAVARGLGFTTMQNVNGTEYVNVRWNRVDAYLQEIGFATSGKKDIFIPENVFYRLAMKAKNEVAERFQARVADEIIPSIRKHGAYMTEDIIKKTLTSPDFLIQLATKLKEEQERNLALTAENNRMKPKEIFADAVSVSDTAILIGELAKILKQNGIETGEKRLFEWMRRNHYLISRKGIDYNMPTQRSMELELFEIKERTINSPNGPTRITKTVLVTGKGQLYFINKFLGSDSMKN